MPQKGAAATATSRLTRLAVPAPDAVEAEHRRDVWQRAQPIGGVDPRLWRADRYGRWMYWYDFSDPTSDHGWKIERRGGHEEPVNWKGSEPHH